MKEQGKNSEDQIKEEEIGNLPENEFRIMNSEYIFEYKNIQNLGKKMELQINSLKTRIEKMQAIFNKEIEKIKKLINNE